MNSGIYILIGSAILVAAVYLYYRKKRKVKVKPSCSTCEFCTPYQMLNNRDERVNVNHCSVLSSRIKSVHGGYMESVAASIEDPDNFSCEYHKPR